MTLVGTKFHRKKEYYDSLSPEEQAEWRARQSRYFKKQQRRLLSGDSEKARRKANQKERARRTTLEREEWSKTVEERQAAIAAAKTKPMEMKVEGTGSQPEN